MEGFSLGTSDNSNYLISLLFVHYPLLMSFVNASVFYCLYWYFIVYIGMRAANSSSPKEGLLLS